MTNELTENSAESLPTVNINSSSNGLTWARMHGKGFCYPAGKLYPGGSYRGGKNLVWFACMSHGRVGR